MDTRTKYRIATGVLVVAVILVINGFGRMQSDAFGGHIRTSTKILFFGSAIVGLSAALARYYWRVQFDKSQATKIEVETLANLGRERMGEKSRRRLN